MTEWNNKLERKILFKSRFTLTLKIARILFILFFIYYIWVTALIIIVDRFNLIKENQYFTRLAVEWQLPNVRGTDAINRTEVTLFGTQKYSSSLLKRVGHEDIVVGEAAVRKGIFNVFSEVEYSFHNQQPNNRLHFSLPEDPRTNQKLKGNAESNVWETLTMLHEGTVGELAFSTTSFMNASQLVDLLKGYHIDILWMPLYTGEFVEYTPGNYGSNDRSLMVYGAIGLTGGFMASENYNSMSSSDIINAGSLERSEQTMLSNMERLLAKPESYYDLLLGFEELPEKYKYLKESGFTVYGAVVTGPVKELLKLQNAPFIQGEQLGEVELWNWNLSR